MISFGAVKSIASSRSITAATVPASLKTGTMIETSGSAAVIHATKQGPPTHTDQASHGWTRIRPATDEHGRTRIRQATDERGRTQISEPVDGHGSTRIKRT